MSGAPALTVCVAALLAACGGGSVMEPRVDPDAGVTDGGEPGDAGRELPRDAALGADGGTVDGGAVDGGAAVDGGGETGSPEGPGPFEVARSTGTVGDAALVVLEPALPAGRRAPLVMFKHGFQLATASYETTLARIASHGYVVVGVDSEGGLFGGPTQREEAEQVSAAIDWATGAAPFADHVDAAHVAVLGHSRGGKCAVMVAARDDRVGAVLALDPVNSCGPGASYSADCPDVTADGWAPSLAVPAGYMGETADGSGGFMPCAPTAQSYATVYDATTAAPAALEWTFDGAAHMTFTDDGGGFAGSFCATATGDEEALREDIRTLAVAFLDRYLRGDVSRDRWLVGAGLPPHVTLRHR